MLNPGDKGQPPPLVLIQFSDISLCLMESACPVGTGTTMHMLPGNHARTYMHVWLPGFL